MEVWKKHIFTLGETMFETTRAILLNNKRELFKKIKDSPVLYFFFTIIMFFSILMFAFLGFYLQVIDTPLEIEMNNVFFMVFFMFMVKSSVDMYNYFVKPEELTYPLSTQIKQKKTIFEVFTAVFLTNLFIWFTLSTLFIFFMSIFPVNVYYPIEYLIFNIGVLTAIFIGSTITISFFSEKRIRIIPTAVLLGFIFLSQEPLFVVFIIPVSLVHLQWNINFSISSYQNIRRKTRENEKSQIKIRNKIKAMFYKEATIIWRDKLFFSFIFTSALTGFGTGYMYLYGSDLLIPEALKDIYSEFLPSLFIFMGVLVVVVYTSVFPSLNLFLNEDKTMWIIRHMPISSKTLILGKSSILFLCFVTAIPFIFYISIFLGWDNLIFVTWFLVQSYIVSASISIPLGVKYVGKKSDVLLLYSVTMVLFVVLGPLAVFGGFVYNTLDYPFIIMSLMLICSIVILYFLLIVSEKILNLKYPKTKG